MTRWDDTQTHQHTKTPQLTTDLKRQIVHFIGCAMSDRRGLISPNSYTHKHSANTSSRIPVTLCFRSFTLSVSTWLWPAVRDASRTSHSITNRSRSVCRFAARCRFLFGFDTSPSIIISSRRFVVKIPHCGRRSLAIIDFWVERGGDYFRWVTNVWIRSLDGVEKRRLTSLFTKQSAIAIVVLGGTTSFAIALRSLQRLHIGFASVSCVLCVYGAHLQLRRRCKSMSCPWDIRISARHTLAHTQKANTRIININSGVCVCVDAMRIR